MEKLHDYLEQMKMDCMAIETECSRIVQGARESSGEREEEKREIRELRRTVALWMKSTETAITEIVDAIHDMQPDRRINVALSRLYTCHDQMEQFLKDSPKRNDEDSPGE